MGIRWRALARLGCMFFVVLALASCGGGGGGDPVPGLTLSISKTSVSFTAIQDAPTPAAQTVVASISGSGTAFVVNPVASGTGFSAFFHITSQTTADIVITPSAPTLAPGTYTGTVTLRVCTDSICTRDVAGSPAVINVSYTIQPGDPTFRSDFSEFVGWPKATVAADMDNDGRMDIVVLTTDHFASGVAEAKGIDIFYQRPAGFDVAAAPTAAITEHAQSLAACDIDGDGKKEILVGYNGADLRVHKLDSNGTPLPPTTLVGLRSFSIECVDLDGDGRRDVVTTGKVGFELQVLLQRNGQLTELEVFPSKDPVTARYTNLGLRAVGDINGDGKPDLLMQGFDRTQSREVFVGYLQTDGGRFIPPGAQTPKPVLLDFPLDPGGTGNGLGVNSVAVVDLFSSGSRNIVAAVGGNQPRSHITIAAYATDGRLLSTSSFATRDIPVSLRVADMDGDGRNDIVVYHNGHGAVGVHYQQADGTFGEEQRLFIAGFADAALTDQAIVIGDFDSNGKRDIALGSQSALFLFFQN